MNQLKLLVPLLFFGVSAALAGTLSDHKKKDAAVFEFVNLVQKRFYVIRRLEGAVERLLEQYGALCGCGQEKDVWLKRGVQYGCWQRGCWQRGCLQRGCELERELHSVYTSWHDCLSYKYLMNDKHVRELLVHLIVLYEALLKVTESYRATFFSERELEAVVALHKKRLSSYGLNDLLDTVDTLAATSRGLLTGQQHENFLHSLYEDDYLQFNGGDFFFLPQESVMSESLDEVTSTTVASAQIAFDQEIFSETTSFEPDAELLETFIKPSEQGEFVVNTTLRFYFIQRLHRAFAQLERLAFRKKVLRIGFWLPPAENFQSPAVRVCVEHMVSQNSLQPLFACWEDVCSYRSIGDAHLIKELLLIAVQVYRLLMKTLAPEEVQDEVPTEEVLDLYSAISSLPLPELFSLLDEFAQQSSSAVTVYQQGTTQGWKSVLKQYWWVPPVVVAGCASLYVRMKRFLSKPQFRRECVAQRKKSFL